MADTEENQQIRDTVRFLHSPISNNKPGCPMKLTPFLEVTTKINGLNKKLTTMQLLHQDKNWRTKNYLNLSGIHEKLEADFLKLDNSGSSNILVYSVSFDVRIKKCKSSLLPGNESQYIRDYIHFDLRIPGTNAGEEGVFSLDFIKQKYAGNVRKLYGVMEHFYKFGRQLVNPNNIKHGSTPDYRAPTWHHDQFIRHTEQLLVAYLALPEASTMLLNRLRVAIREKYTDANQVKVYNMGLHLHSTKSCCAPCEYALIGLMNDYNGFNPDRNNPRCFGFLSNFQSQLTSVDDRVEFSTPRKSAFKLLVTVSASRSCKDHQKQPDYEVEELEPQDPDSLYYIRTRNRDVEKWIYQTMLITAYARNRIPSASSSTLSDRTVGISGSKATQGSSKTIDKLAKCRDEELESQVPDLEKSFELLCEISDDAM